MVDDEDATRDVIDATIEFVKRATSPAFQASLRRGIPEAAAAAHVAAGDFAAAAAAYAELVKQQPQDVRLRLSYGEALLGASQFAAACAELDQLKGKGLGPRDLGVPAARACMQKGDGDAAIAWLKTIPQRFLPREIEQDPVFAPVRDRAEFKALFRPAGRVRGPRHAADAFHRSGGPDVRVAHRSDPHLPSSTSTASRVCWPWREAPPSPVSSTRSSSPERAFPAGRPRLQDSQDTSSAADHSRPREIPPSVVAIGVHPRLK